MSDPSSPGPADLEQRYRDYLAVLDERRFDDLAAFVADVVVVDDVPVSARRYREAREDDVRRIPDVSYDVQHLVVAGDLVAARLRFDCTPVLPFRGREPSGSRVVFTEHVFYRFRDGRIVQVWSLLDVEALQRQSGPATGPGA
jgi:predicted ester cyclase